MAISKKIENMISSSSFIRKMFETGSRLKAEFGADKVYDFSLGNPDLPPPQCFTDELVNQSTDIGGHKYMPNAGYPDVRTKVAAYVSSEQEVDLSADNIVMTCGAGGALNICLKTILNPGDKVLVSTPYFVEYRSYCDNHNGILETVPGADDFDLDLKALETAIDPSVAAVIINSPNNPSGRIYPEETIRALGQLLEKKSGETGRIIYLISDEPYRKISYDGIEVPPVMKHYRNSLVCTSYSKDLSLPGERIGWAAAHPAIDGGKMLVDGLILCNRILGYVNAPALLQRTIGELQGASVDLSIYARRRKILCDGLKTLGYEFQPPEGTFYLFVKAPGGDDMAFVDELQKQNILVVPGTGFGCPGYFRIAFCVEDRVIENSMPGFGAAMK